MNAMATITKLLDKSPYDAAFVEFSDALGGTGNVAIRTVKIDQADPRLPAAYEKLVGNGLKPNFDRGRYEQHAHEFQLSIRRSYTDDQLLLFPGFWLAPCAGMGDDPVLQDDGVWRVKKNWLSWQPHESWEIIYAFFNILFARGRALESLRSLNLGLNFEPAKVTGMKGPWAKFETVNVMARLWAGQNIMNAKLNGPARPDNSSGCFVGDWLFSDTQFKYAPTALAELDRVGITRMFETLGNFKQRVHDASPMLISNRVYCALRDGGAIFDAMPLLSSEEAESPEDQAIIDFWERPSRKANGDAAS